MNKGGRYIVNDKGERELVERTKPAEPRSSVDNATQNSDAAKTSSAKDPAEQHSDKAGAIPPRPSGSGRRNDKAKGK